MLYMYIFLPRLIPTQPKAVHIHWLGLKLFSSADRFTGARLMILFQIFRGCSLTPRGLQLPGNTLYLSSRHMHGVKS